MKKINFAVAFAMLCGLSCESFAIDSGINNHEMNNPAIGQDQVVVHNAHLAGVNIPVLERPVLEANNVNFGEGLDFTSCDVAIHDGNCGYDSLFTDRESVYNAISSVYNTNWDILSVEQQNTLRKLIARVTEDCGNRLTYHGTDDWEALDKLLNKNIFEDHEGLCATLGGLICYIRGENLRIFSRGDGGDIYKFNENWPVRYMLHDQRWYTLQPNNEQEARQNDIAYNSWWLM